MYSHDKIKAPIEKIKSILVKLARGDLIEYKGLGWFTKIKDPILNEFLKVWGKVVVAKQSRDIIEEETIKKFRRMGKRFHEYKGYLAEVYMIQVLWNSQRGTLPGKYFHGVGDIIMPDRFFYIDQRHRKSIGKKVEVDICASAADEIWMAESKWWSGRKVGPDVVENLLRQAEIVREREGEDLKTLRLWIFAHDGVTQKAEELIRENGILWSTRQDLDGLLEAVNLRKLPVVEDNA